MVKVVWTNYVRRSLRSSSDSDVAFFFSFLFCSLFFTLLFCFFVLSPPIPYFRFLSSPAMYIYSPFVFPLRLKPSDLGPVVSRSPVSLSHLISLVLPICFTPSAIFLLLPSLLPSPHSLPPLPLVFDFCRSLPPSHFPRAPFHLALSVTASLAFSNQAG